MGLDLAVPNFSFEAPPVVRDEQNPFGALPYIDDWDETAIGLGDEEDQNTGVFLNTDPQEADHITDAHLLRLAFVSSLIGNDLRQTVSDSFLTGWTYEVKVAVGKSATFPVGDTEELEVAVFYFDGAVEQVIAATTISGSQVNTTSLVDVAVSLPAVQAGDAWVGQPVGILIRPATDDPNDGDGEGFWNVDNVRLSRMNTVVPATSTWGLIVLTLATAIGGTLALGQRREMAI
jgi:hypothetical protein